MNFKRRSANQKFVFAPGCALMIYKPELAGKIHKLLRENIGEMELLLTCCQHKPELSENLKVISVCPGCDRRYSNDFKGVSSISLWEVINENNFLDYPDYKGRSMSIIDACPTRDEERVQNSIRELLLKMNIHLVEPKNTRKESTCCGDIYYGSMPTGKVKELMIENAREIPVNDVVVHCVSCIIGVLNGGKSPRYLADLLFNEESLPETVNLDEWHKDLTGFIDLH